MNLVARPGLPRGSNGISRGDGTAGSCRAVRGLVRRGKLWLLCLVRKAKCSAGSGSSGFSFWLRRGARTPPGCRTPHAAAEESWHHLGPLGPLEIFHLHFVFMEEFPARMFPALAQGCAQICKAETSHPSRGRQDRLAAVTLTQLSLPGAHGPWPERVARVASLGPAMETPAAGSGLCHGC